MDYEYLKSENKNILNKERNVVGRKNNAGYYLLYFLRNFNLKLEWHLIQ